MPKLVVNPTSGNKKEVSIAARVISIGRDPSNDLVLSDSMVSRRHAILEQRDDVFVLRDNGSANGTLVNGDKVDSEHTLRDGDLVAIGSARLLFQLDNARSVGAAATDPPAEDGDVLAHGEAASDVRNVEADKGRPSGKLRCPACDTPSLSNDRFCRKCGAELVRKQVAVCTACGRPVQLPAEFCGHCGHELPARDKVSSPHPADAAELDLENSDPDHRPALPRPWKSPVGAMKNDEPAGFGVRLVAAVVDGLILGIPLFLTTLVWGTFALSATDTGVPAFSLPLLAIAFPMLCLTYFVLFWGYRGATPGKSLLAIVVESEEGESPIGCQRAALRALGYVASLLIMGLGFVLIAFSDDKRGLHDRIAGTRVMRNL